MRWILGSAQRTLPPHCTAMTSEMGWKATSSLIRCGRPLSKSVKSIVFKPFTNCPCISTTVVGAIISGTRTRISGFWPKQGRTVSRIRPNEIGSRFQGARVGKRSDVPRHSRLFTSIGGSHWLMLLRGFARGNARKRQAKSCAAQFAVDRSQVASTQQSALMRNGQAQPHAALLKGNGRLKQRAPRVQAQARTGIVNLDVDTIAVHSG